MDTYQLGNDLQQIMLAVDINTTGLAASRAVIYPPSQGISVATSTNATGDINRTNIGVATTLLNKRLSIFTQINLWGNDNQRRDQYNNITTSYFLDGGNEGRKVFNNPMIDVDQNYTVVFILKYIDLI